MCKFVIAPNNELLIGVPNDIDWKNSIVQISDGAITVYNERCTAKIDDEMSNEGMLLSSLIGERASVVLCFINDDQPHFETADVF